MAPVLATARLAAVPAAMPKAVQSSVRVVVSTQQIVIPVSNPMRGFTHAMS